LVTDEDVRFYRENGYWQRRPRFEVTPVLAG
jgi:hypothetical protein